MKWLVLLLLLPQAYALEWSEILYNPAGSDNGKEFVELLGNESLEGCTISDSASTDRLKLNSTGTEVILIVEDGSEHMNSTATIYTAGSAIGNGLGNTADAVSIACESIALNMSYNLTQKEGFSIIFVNGSWAAGQMGGTPGMRETPAAHNTTQAAEATVHNITLNTTCDDTLLVVVNATEAAVGDHLLVTIRSAGYAWFEVAAGSALLSKGDTLQSSEHLLLLSAPGRLKITAHASECNAEQRAAKIVTVHAPEQAAVNMTLQEHAIEAPEQELPSQEPVQQVVRKTVIDEDRDAVPWIAGFGIATVTASCIVFLQLLRRGEA